jgi:hypothetical protein
VRERKRAMTENDWLTAEDPQGMLEFLRDGGKLSERRARLFAVACCLTCFRYRLTDTRSTQAVRVAAQYADGLVDTEVVVETVALAYAVDETRYGLAYDAYDAAAAEVAALTLDDPLAAARISTTVACDKLEQQVQAALLRDLFGPLPFCEIPLDPAWLAWNDGVVAKLAVSIYERRAFEQMPVLADALEEAGCGNQEMLTHCRQQGQTHVRGCWLLDLILGRG